MTNKRRMADNADLVEFNRAVSIIMDRVALATSEELADILVIQNDLLIFTLHRINEKGVTNDPGN